MGAEKLKLTTSPPVLLRNPLRETCRLSVLHRVDRSPLDSPDDPQVASATAQDAVQSAPDLRLRWMGVFVEQRFGIHDHSVHTVAALRRLLFNERLLEPVRTGYAAQTFQRSNIPVLCIAHRYAARAHRVALQHYRATAALRKTAAKLWPIQPQVVAQHVQQRSAGVCIHDSRPSIHFQRDSRHNKFPSSTSRGRTIPPVEPSFRISTPDLALSAGTQSTPGLSRMEASLLRKMSPGSRPQRAPARSASSARHTLKTRAVARITTCAVRLQSSSTDAEGLR